MTKFQMPTEFNTSKSNGGEKSAGTISIYKTHLNRLAAAGFDTVDKIISNSSDVIKTILAFPKKDDESAILYKSRLRVYFSAIFMILPATIRATPNAYYSANKKLQDANPADFK